MSIVYIRIYIYLFFGERLNLLLRYGIICKMKNGRERNVPSDIHDAAVQGLSRHGSASCAVGVLQSVSAEKAVQGDEPLRASRGCVRCPLPHGFQPQGRDI